MKLEEQVTSLELSKRLKELGFKQESLFYIVEQYGNIPVINGTSFVGLNYSILTGLAIQDLDIKETTFRCYSAYTVSELGEMLPKGVIIENYKGKEDYWNLRLDNEDNSKSCSMGELNLANAMAKMLIYLKENNLI